MAQRDFNQVLDDINMVEQSAKKLLYSFVGLLITRRFRQMGFTRGYSIGEEAGWKDGYSYGLKKGAQIAAEIGFYQGFVHAWIGILERDESSKQRKLLALRSLLELTRRYHRTNLHDEDCAKRLETIRAKFKQVNSLLTGAQSPMSTTFDDDLPSTHSNAHSQGLPTNQPLPKFDPHPSSKTQKFTSEMSF